VYPAVEGIDFVEIDSSGRVLQRSTTTDSQGNFAFTRPVTGSRVVAVVERPRRQPLVLSARFTGDRSSLTVTPLTTAFDHLVAAGLHPTEASARVKALLEESCDVSPGVLEKGGLTAETSEASIQSLPGALRSLHAYFSALRQIGIGLESVDFAERSEHRSALLKKMCATARTLRGPEWLGETRAWMAGELGLPGSEVFAKLPAVTNLVVDETLRLIGSELPALEFPQAAAMIAPSVEQWRGRELAIAREFTLAATVASSVTPLGRQVLTEGAVARTRFRRDATYALDKTGAIVERLVVPVVKEVAASKRPGLVTLQNTGASSLRVQPDLAGLNLPELEDVVRDVLAMPAAASEPLHVRAWRYVVANTSHYWPISAGLFVHRPELFLRSIGQGFCDDRASVLHWIWKALGYEARVWSLNGHVVPEVQVNGRWEMLDPDLAVFYVTKSGAVASVMEIQADRSLVTSPVRRLHSAVSWAYDGPVADIYESAEDNRVEAWYSTPYAAAAPSEFVLPPGATLTLDADPWLEFQTIDDAVRGLTPRVELSLPPGFSGTVPLPLVLLNVEGDALIGLLGKAVNPQETDVRAIIADFYRRAPAAGIDAIEVQNVGPTGLKLELMVNLGPAGSTPARLRVTSRDLSGLIVTIRESTEAAAASTSASAGIPMRRVGT
jgi:hypothetical protein